MNVAAARQIVGNFLKEKEVSIGEPLVILDDATEGFDGGWGFYYQGKAYVETGNFSKMLVGHGPIVVLRDGRLFEGGSLDRDAASVLKRFAD